jgi:hypothetical protein
MSRSAGRFSRWVNRVLDADERYICGSCDDRFPGRTEGVAHVVACHPQFAGVFATEAADNEWTPASEPLPACPLGTTRPFMPVWG